MPEQVEGIVHVRITSPTRRVWVGIDGRFTVTGEVSSSRVPSRLVEVGVDVDGLDGGTAIFRPPDSERWIKGLTVSGQGDREVTATARVPRGSGFVVEPDTATRTIQVQRDTRGPELSIDSPQGRIEVQGGVITITVDGEVRDDESGVGRVDVGVGEPSERASVRDGRWSARLTLEGIGRHTISARAEDRVGNRTRTERRVRTVDTGRPAIRITEPRARDRRVDWPADGELVIPLAGTASDAATGVSSVSWRVGDDSGDADDASGGGEPWSRWEARVPIPAPGRYRIAARARDGAGNDRTRRVTVIADDDPPGVVDVEPPTPHTVFSSGDVTVEVRGGVAPGVASVDVVEWTLDGGDPQPARPLDDDWSDWCFTARLERFGEHRLLIRSVHPSGRSSDPRELVVRHLEVFE